MNTPSSSPIALELAAGRARVARALRDNFAAIWRRVVAEAARPAAVVRVWNVYNEGYLIRGAGPDAPLLAVDLAAPRHVFSGSRDVLLESFPMLAGLLITHRHGDHADADVVRRILDAGAPVVVCGDTWDGLQTRLQLAEPPPGLCIVRAGDSLAMGGYQVQALEANHFSRQVKESLAFSIGIDGVSIIHAGDHRDFDGPVAGWPRGADLAILSVYHPVIDRPATERPDVPGFKGQVSDRAYLARIQWDQHPAMATLVQRLAPRAVALGHLYELGHEPEMLWRFFDTGLIREALFARFPHLTVHALAPGQCLPLLPS